MQLNLKQDVSLPGNHDCPKRLAEVSSSYTVNYTFYRGRGVQLSNTYDQFFNIFMGNITSLMKTME
jgi:hypothetical protein